ncbi:MAG: mechanosensitive ion channel [Clostridiales bacterium]|nr:mechanosensitive ion channel [Clostridiales bacterium]
MVTIFRNVGMLLTAETDAFPDTTETLEVFSNAQAGLQEVAENPGLIRTWLEGLVPDLLNFALQIVIAFVVYAVGSKIIRLIVKMVSRGMDRKETDEGVKQFLLPVIRYSLYIILIFIIMGLFGIATTSAVAVLGSAGVAIGLALQGSLSNFAGGVLILLLKPFRVGDYIVEHAGNNEGTVAEISIFYTKLMTVDNRVVVVPNGTLANCSITNVSDVDRRRVDIAVGIAYEADIKKAKEVLFKVAEEDEARLPEEEAVVFVDSLGDSAVNMGIRVWVKAEDYWPAKWRLTENVKYALDEQGISIPYQQIDVQIKQ